MPVVPPPRRIVLEEPAPLLRWLDGGPEEVDLDRIELSEIWGLVALATLGRRERASLVPARTRGETGASRFAHAVGFGDVIEGSPAIEAAQPARTVRLARLRDFVAIEPAAGRISRLIISDPQFEETRRAVYYVLVELLRNVLQHSQDPLGAVVAAQVDWRGQRDRVQIAVGDAGIGIFAAMKGMHRSLDSAQAAIERALWPHISGAFEQGWTGSPNQSNAGLGLFFISEIAKLELGKLVIASRGATLVLEGGEEPDQPTFRFVEPKGLGFPGTLVAFEMPVGEVADYGGLMEAIQARAKERQPRRVVHRWFTFDPPPPTVRVFLVSYASENTQAAAEFSERELEPRLFRRESVALDFRNIDICTQSYLHALLYAALRVAWARQAPIYVVHAAPAVRSGLEFLESYALGG